MSTRVTINQAIQQGLLKKVDEIDDIVQFEPKGRTKIEFTGNKKMGPENIYSVDIYEDGVVMISCLCGREHFNEYETTKQNMVTVYS